MSNRKTESQIMTRLSLRAENGRDKESRGSSAKLASTTTAVPGAVAGAPVGTPTTSHSSGTPTSLAIEGDSARSAENRRGGNSADMGGSRPAPPVDTASAGIAGGAVVDGAAPVPSPRLSAAERRLQEEKQWLVDVPRYCFAEPTRGSDFVWSFRVSGLHGTMYQVCIRGGPAKESLYIYGG